MPALQAQSHLPQLGTADTYPPRQGVVTEWQKPLPLFYKTQ